VGLIRWYLSGKKRIKEGVENISPIVRGVTVRLRWGAERTYVTQSNLASCCREIRSNSKGCY